MAKYDPNALDKFDAWTMEDITPKELASSRESIISGDTVQVDRLYRSMTSRWSRLRKCLSEKANAVKALSFSVVPWADKDQDPSPQAQELADVVDRALWTRETAKKQNKWALSFMDLLGSLTYAMARGLSVYQIARRYDSVKGLWVASSFTPVLPQYYGWATSSNEPDALLFYPEGFATARGSRSAGGQDFPDGEFLVAMLQDGVDHPIFNAQLRTLIGWFGAASFGVKWLMEYCASYGQPYLHGSTHEDNKSSLENALKYMKTMGFIVTDENSKISMVSATGQGSLPQSELIKMADAQAAELILGQTLTSNQGDKGSQALGNVHNSVREDFVDAAANFVIDVINSQLIPAIVKWNYGHDFGGQLPTLEFSHPEKKNNLEKLNYLEKLVSLGVPLTKQYVHDFLGLPIPSDGDELFNPAAPSSDPVLAALSASRRPKL